MHLSLLSMRELLVEGILNFSMNKYFLIIRTGKLGSINTKYCLKQHNLPQGYVNVKAITIKVIMAENVENKKLVPFQGKGTSIVWQWFRFWSCNGVVNKAKAVCSLCTKEYAYQSKFKSTKWKLKYFHFSNCKFTWNKLKYFHFNNCKLTWNKCTNISQCMTVIGWLGSFCFKLIVNY